MASAAELAQELRSREAAGQLRTPEYRSLYKQYVRQRTRERRKTIEAKYRTPVEREAPAPDFIDQIEETLKGIPAGAINFAELGALGIATLLDEENELKARGIIQDIAAPAKRLFSADVGSEEAVGRKFGEALGSFAGLGLTSLVPGVGVPLAGTLAAGAGAGEASERARAAGATVRERGQAALKGAGVGLTELIPLGKLRDLQQTLGKDAFLNGVQRIKRAAAAGGFEAAQEAAAGVAQNAIQRGYDPTQDLVNTDVFEEGAYGGAVGATVQLLLDLAVPRTKAESGKAYTAEEEAQIEKEINEAAEREGEGVSEEEINEAANAVAAGPAKTGEPGKATDAEIIAEVRRRAADAKLKGLSPNEYMEQYPLDPYFVKPGQAGLTATESSGVDTKKVDTKKVGEKKKGKDVKDPALQVEGYFVDTGKLTNKVNNKIKVLSDETITDRKKSNNRTRLRKNIKELEELVASPPEGVNEEYIEELNGTIARAKESLGPDLKYSEVEPEDEKVATGKEIADLSGKTDEELDNELNKLTGNGTKALSDLTSEEENRINDLRDEISEREKTATETQGEEVATEAEETGEVSLEGIFKTTFDGKPFATGEDQQLALDLKQIRKGQKSSSGATKPEKKKFGEGFNSFRNYLLSYDTVEDAINGVAYDYAAKKVLKGKTIRLEEIEKEDRGTVRGEVQYLEQGTKGRNAVNAYNYINDKLSFASRKALKDKTNKYEAELEKYKEQETAKEKQAKKEQERDIDEVVTSPPTYDSKENLVDVIAPLKERFGLSDVQIKNYQDKRDKYLQTLDATKRQRAAEDKEKGAVGTATTGLSKKEIEKINAQKREEAAEAERKKAEAEARQGVSVADLLPYMSDQDRKTLQFNEAKVAEFNQEIAGLSAQSKRIKGNSAKAKNNRKNITSRVEALKLEAASSQERIDKILSAAYDKRFKDEETTALLAGAEAERFAGLTEAEIEEIKNREARNLRTFGQTGESNVYEESGVRISPDNPMGFMLPTESTSKSSQSVDTEIVSSFSNNDLTEGLVALGNSAPTKYLQNISKKFAALTGSTKVEVVENLKDSYGKPSSGVFNPETNTIQLDRATGMNSHTVLHEMAHAVGSAELSNPKSAFTIRMTKLYNDAKGMLDTEYGAQDLQEFFAEAMANEGFRKKLARLHPDGTPKNVLQRFIENMQSLLNRLLGRTGYQSKGALKEFDSLVDHIIAPAPASRGGEILAMNADNKGAKESAETLDGIQKDLKKGPKDEASLADQGRQFLNDSPSAVGNVMLGLRDLQGVADMANQTFPELIINGNQVGTELQRIAETQRGDMNKSDARVDFVANRLAKLYERDPKQYDLLNNAIYNYKFGSTIHQIDPTLTKTEAQKRYAGEQLKKWEELQKEVWSKMLPKTRNDYTLLRNLYKSQYLKLRDTIYERMVDLVGTKEANAVKNKVFDKLFERNKLDVYFPLARQGRYKVTFNKKEADAEGDVYNMEMYDTLAQAERAVEELRKDTNISEEGLAIIDSKTVSGSQLGTRPSVGFVSEVLNALDKTLLDANPLETAADKKRREDLKEQIVSTFVDTLPETSFARSLQRRQNTPGYDSDSLAALRTKAYDLGRQTIRLQKSKEIMSLESKLSDAYKEKQETLKRDLFGNSTTQVYEEMLKRTSFIRNPPPDMLAQTLNQGAFIYTIGFNASSAIVNLSQVPLFVLPYLGGIHGYRKSSAEIMKATGIVGSSLQNADVGLDNFYTVQSDGTYKLKEDVARNLSPEDLQTYKDMAFLVETAVDRGQLTKSFLIDQLSLQKEAFKSGPERSGNIFRKALDTVTGISAVGFNVAERANRQTTMLAAYNLELKKLREKNKTLTEDQKRQAAAEAIRVTQETNGGAFIETSPRLTQQGLLRVAMMYKSYGLRMYHTMLKSGKQLADNAFPDTEEGRRLRKEAFKQLLGWHGSALFFAGVQGVPLYGAVSMIANMILDDDEEDFDTIVRQYVGEGFYKGGVNKLSGAITGGEGFDVATRIRLTGLLIQDNRYNQDPTLEEFIGFYLGGPALSTVERIGRAGKDFYNGEIERGIENALPAGIANAMKSLGRYQREGIVTRRGDPIKDDLTSGEIAAQFFGFAPAEYTRKQEENLILKKIDNAVSTQRSRLLKRYYLALRNKDIVERREVLQEVREFNRDHPQFRISGKSIQRSIKSHRRTSAAMHNGVRLSPAMRRVLAEQQNYMLDAYE